MPKPRLGGGVWRRMQTQPPEEHSVQKFLTPSSLPPLPPSPILPPGRPGIQAVFQAKKDPMTSHLLPRQPTVSSQAALPVRMGREPVGASR